MNIPTNLFSVPDASWECNQCIRCSKSLTERRNAALKYRADLKKQNGSIQGYVKFPATLMIKRTGERKNIALKKSFELQFFKKFSFSVLESFLF